MQRRTLLGLVAGTGAVGALGASATVLDRPAGPSATYADEPVPPAAALNGAVVAEDTTTAGSERYGTVRQSASVVDLEPTGRYALVARHHLLPGSNYDASTAWKTRSLTVEHAWKVGSLVSHTGDVVPAAGDTDSNLALATDQSPGRYRWHVTFDAASGNTSTFRFATVVEREGTPEHGELLVEVTFGAGFTTGRLGPAERDVATAQLVMGATSEPSP